MDKKSFANRNARRTKLTPAAGVAVYVEEKLASNKKLKEKTVINDLIRKGIQDDEQQERPRFEIKPFKSKLMPGITPRRIEKLLDEI